MAEKTSLYVINVALTKEKCTKVVPFYYWKNSTSLTNQLAYYELLDYDLTDAASLFLLTGQVAPLQTSLDHAHQVDSTVESRITTDIKGSVASVQDIMDYEFIKSTDEASEPMQVAWLDKLKRGLSAVSGENPENMIEDFMTYFIERGLFDCYCSSFKSSATLKLFFVLLDLIPKSRTVLAHRASKAITVIPQDFELDDQVANDKIYGLALVCCLAERNRGSPIFIRCLSFLQNRLLLAKLTHLCLVAADLMDETLFGLDDPEYLKKRLGLYAWGLQSNTIAKTCEARISGITSFFRSPQAPLVRSVLNELALDTMIERMPSSRDVSAWNSFDLVAKVNGFCLNYMKVSSSQEDIWKGLLRSHLEQCQSGNSIDSLAESMAVARKTIISPSCETLDNSTKNRISELLERQEFKNAAHLLGSVLRKPLELSQLIDVVGAMINLSKEIAKTSHVAKIHLTLCKAEATLAKIQTFLMLSSLKKKATKSLLINLGYDLNPQLTEDDKLKLLKLSFCILCIKPSDFDMGKKALKFIATKRNIPTSSAFDEILEYLNSLFIVGESLEAFSARICSLSNQIIKNRKQDWFSEEENRILEEAMDEKAIQPSLVCFVDQLINIQYHVEDPLEAEKSPKSTAEVMEFIVKPRQSFSDKFLSKFEESNGPSSDSQSKLTVAQKLQETYTRLHKLLLDEPMISLFDKEMFNVYAVVEGLATLEENNVELFRAYFVSNNQKCTIFKVPHTSSVSADNLMKTFSYIKMFHPKVLCFYGIILEVDLETELLNVYYVAENFNNTLSMLSPDRLEKMNPAKKVQIVFDMVYSLLSFHSVGLSFSLLNPDMVTITNQTTKLLFPFFLPNRSSFSSSYIGSIVEQDKMYFNLLFLKPALLRDTRKAIPPKLSIMDPEYFADFKELMANDLYALAMLCCFIFNKPHFEKLFAQVIKSPLSKYLKSIGDALEALNLPLLQSVDCLGTAVVTQLIQIIAEAEDCNNTFEFYKLVCNESSYEFPVIDPWTVKKNFQDTIGFIGAHPSEVGVYYPCCVRTVLSTKAEIDQQRAYFKDQLLHIGPYFNLDSPDNYNLKLFLSDQEWALVDITEIEVSKIEIFRRNHGKAPPTKIILDEFLSYSWMPGYEFLKDLHEKTYLQSQVAAPSKEKKALLVSELLEAHKKMDIDSLLVDPFGNFLRISRDERGIPKFTKTFFLEALSAHNLGKAMLVVGSNGKTQAIYSRVSTVTYGELSGKILRYADLAKHLEAPSMVNSYLVHFIGQGFDGDIIQGKPRTGQLFQYLENKEKGSHQEIHYLCRELFYEMSIHFDANDCLLKGSMFMSVPNGRCSLIRADSAIFKGFMLNGKPHGKGTFFDNSGSKEDKVLFSGYFSKGRPKLGFFKSETLSVDSLILTRKNKGPVRANHSDSDIFFDQIRGEVFQAFALGFDSSNLKDMPRSQLKFFKITKQFSLKQFTSEPLIIADNATYEGMVIDDKPQGKGAVMMDGNVLVRGTWNSDKQTVIGEVCYHDQHRGKVANVRGVFTFSIGSGSTASKKRFTVAGHGIYKVDADTTVMGEFRHNGFFEKEAWVAEKSNGVERWFEINSRNPDSQGNYPDSARAIVVPSNSPSLSSCWLEKWERIPPKDTRDLTSSESSRKELMKTKGVNQNYVLSRVYNNHKELHIANIPIKCKGIELFSRAKHVEGNTYELLEDSKSATIVKSKNFLILANLITVIESDEKSDVSHSTISKNKSDDDHADRPLIKATRVEKKVLQGFMFSPTLPVGPEKDKKFDEVCAYFRDPDGISAIRPREHPKLEEAMFFIKEKLEKIENLRVFRGEFKGLEPRVGSLLDLDRSLHLGEFEGMDLHGNGIQWHREHKVAVIGSQFNRGQKDGVFLVSDSLDEILKNCKSARHLFIGEYAANKKNGLGICFYYKDKNDQKPDQQFILFRHGEIQTVFSDK